MTSGNFGAGGNNRRRTATALVFSFFVVPERC